MTQWGGENTDRRKDFDSFTPRGTPVSDEEATHMRRNAHPGSDGGLRTLRLLDDRDWLLGELERMRESYYGQMRHATQGWNALWKHHDDPDLYGQRCPTCGELVPLVEEDEAHNIASQAQEDAKQ
jgi:hypothetical protein